jgi:periplasmic copper chaperone A
MRPALLLCSALLWGCAPDSGQAPMPPTASPAPAVLPAPAVAGDILVITGAWVRQVPPTAQMTAGYLRVHNPGAEPVVIVGVESPLFRSVELHGTVMVDGVARMRHQPEVEVPPGESVSFEPGGLHLMLMQAVNGVPSSGAIPLSLLLEDGGRLDFEAPIGQPNP